MITTASPRPVAGGEGGREGDISHQLGRHSRGNPLALAAASAWPVLPTSLLHLPRLARLPGNRPLSDGTAAITRASLRNIDSHPFVSRQYCTARFPGRKGTMDASLIVPERRRARAPPSGARCGVRCVPGRNTNAFACVKKSSYYLLFCNILKPFSNSF